MAGKTEDKNTPSVVLIVIAIIEAMALIIVAIINMSQDNKFEVTINQYESTVAVLSESINDYQATISDIEASASQEISQINAQYDNDLAKAKAEERSKGYNEGYEANKSKYEATISSIEASAELRYLEEHSKGYDEGYNKGIESVATTVSSNNVNQGGNMTDICPAYQSLSYTEYSAKKNGGVNKFNMAGVTYTNGFKFRAGYTGSDSSGWAVYNLNREYTLFTGVLCHVDGEGSTSANTTLSIFLDGTLEREYEVTSDMAPINFSFDVTGVGQIKIVLKAAGYDGIYYGIGNPVLK